MKIKDQIYFTFIFFSVLVMMVLSCTKNQPANLYERISSDHTHIDFENQLSYHRKFNIVTYQNFYNGGGVGIGDFNNDGLQDLYLTANMQSNKLYLNEGNFEFRDVTETAGVSGSKAWSTGVSLVDINADGWLDIYVCNAGLIEGDDRKNELFINNGDGTFTERAGEVGLADPGFSTHAAFFDYDRDGDLDAYILNNSFIPGSEVTGNKRKRTTPDRLGGDRLIRNDGGRFTDVTEQAGIYNSIVGYGLGVSVSDLNKDGWLDMYVSNDFFERDYIYMNKGDGTFKEAFTEQIRSTSVSSMGADIADFTGDGWPEIFVTEMLQEDESRLKTNMDFHSWDDYQFYLNDGFHHQFSRNMLQLHLGEIPDKGIAFSEVGRMAEIEATDWSWAANILDMDNDGFNDLFVSNGLYRDILNIDYSNYVASPRKEFFMRQGGKMVVNFKKLISRMPSNRISNYAYKGAPDLTFTKKTTEWGLEEPSFSNGSAYGDLNNDGYQDLVVNNVNMPVFVYRNRGNEINPQNNYLKVDLIGMKKNVNAIGAKVTLKANGKLFYLEQIPQRGFQSSIDNRLNFGLGKIETIDTLRVDWPYGGHTLLTDVNVNQTLVLEEDQANLEPTPYTRKKEPFFKNITDRFPFSYHHRENEFNDFKKNPMLYHMRSTEGPKAVVADVNGDGLQDLFIGGAKGSAGQLFIRDEHGQYRNTNQRLFEADKASEDLGALFFDADGDGDQDLYVTSGGNEALAGSGTYADRLYINDGSGTFAKSSQPLPNPRPESTSAVAAADFDDDGDLDLFVGVRLRPGLPGIPQSGYILENDGIGQFKNVTDNAAPGMKDLGLVTDASWSDYDNDGDDDLIVVGKWMPIKLFENEGDGTFTDRTEAAGLTHTSGWWNVIEAADIDGDGDIDFVAGNMGLNSRFRASSEQPMSLYISDFDRNGTIEQVICIYNDQKSYPLLSRDQMVERLPQLKAKYPTSESFAGQTIEDIFTDQQLNAAEIYNMTMLESIILRNNGENGFAVETLPPAAQVAPIYAVLADDLDGDQNLDLLLGGNLHNVKPSIGRYDASYGTFLKGTGEGNFQVMETKHSGLVLEGEIRDFELLNTGIGNPKILVIRNNDTVQIWEAQSLYKASE